MSRAFVRESDAESDEPYVPPPSAQLPFGVQNYMTRDGADRMRKEVGELADVVRPGSVEKFAASDGQTQETRRRLMKVDHRIRWLTQSLGSATVVDLAGRTLGQICFGAIVTLQDESGSQRVIRIVGVDEVDLDRGWISWLSPLAKALMRAKPGETVTFHPPKGEERLHVVRISAEPTESDSVWFFPLDFNG
jgi:transcription elongation factor GreB